jgi:hypothetical protein
MPLLTAAIMPKLRKERMGMTRREKLHELSGLAKRAKSAQGLHRRVDSDAVFDNQWGGIRFSNTGREARYEIRMLFRKGNRSARKNSGPLYGGKYNKGIIAIFSFFIYSMASDAVSITNLHILSHISRTLLL